MPVPFNENMYYAVKQWLEENPQDKSLSEPIKQSLLRFEILTEREKEELQVALLAIHDLPEVLQQFMPDRLGAQPDDLLDMIGRYLSNQNRGELATADKRMHSLFHQSNLLDKFLERVAYGMQDKVEQLFAGVYPGDVAKIQEALRYQGRFTDYSGRSFNCTAYEYAYWAKDTHMCRMLERYMDAETKAFMATRIDEIERIDAETGQPVGLVYHQAGQEHRSAHFDFTPLKEAYQRYLSGYNAWYAADDVDGLKAAWTDVGKAQRNVPAHVAQEYCRRDRKFDPRPEFNEETLPRVLTSFITHTRRDGSWFPLAASNSGLGFDFAMERGHCVVAKGWKLEWAEGAASSDLAAITHLDNVRTVECTQSLQNLHSPEASHRFSR